MSKLAIQEPILVTGAAGFLGNAMVHRFQKEAQAVRALILPSETPDPEWGENVQVFEGDVTERQTLEAAMDGVGTVFHNVARVGDWGPEELFHRVGVLGTENVIELALKAQARFLLASSITVNGDEIGDGIRHENQPFGAPLGPYSRTKQKQEQLALYRHLNDGLRLTVIRPGNITGAGSQPWVHEALKQLRKKAPAIVGTGETRCGLCYVENVVEVFALAAAQPKSIGKVYNALDDLQQVSWGDYIRRLAEIAGAPAPKSIPAGLARFLAGAGERAGRLLGREDRPPLTYEALNLVSQDMEFSLDRAHRDLGYRPLFDYEQAMQSIADYVGKQSL